MSGDRLEEGNSDFKSKELEEGLKRDMFFSPEKEEVEEVGKGRRDFKLEIRPVDLTGVFENSGVKTR